VTIAMERRPGTRSVANPARGSKGERSGSKEKGREGETFIDNVPTKVAMDHLISLL